MKTSDLGGMDSLLSMVQMPSGVPVACVAINGAKNAAIYATQILGACDPEYRKVIEKMKQEMADARRSAVSPQYKESMSDYQENDSSSQTSDRFRNAG